MICFGNVTPIKNVALSFRFTVSSTIHFVSCVGFLSLVSRVKISSLSSSRSCARALGRDTHNDKLSSIIAEALKCSDDAREINLGTMTLGYLGWKPVKSIFNHFWYTSVREKERKEAEKDRRGLLLMFFLFTDASFTHTITVEWLVTVVQCVKIILPHLLTTCFPFFLLLSQFIFNCYIFVIADRI